MEIFKNNFNDLSDDDKALLDSYFTGYPYKGAGYTLLANYVWRNEYCLNWEVYEGLLLLSGSSCRDANPKAVFSMPMTSTGEYDIDKLRETILYAQNRFEAAGFEFRMGLIPEHMLPLIEEAFPGEVEFIENRDEDEYVYLKEKMITLSGRALHKKRNHMNFFKKTYEYEARKLRVEDTDIVMNLVRDLVDEKNPDENDFEEKVETMDPDDLKTLKAEEYAISESMTSVESPRMFSVGIFVDEKLVAFSLGERLTDDMAVAHFEKARSEYRGLYQIVASEFCKFLPSDVKYINREEDMGIENLRHAKESLRPETFVRKFSVKFKQNS